MWFFRVKPLLMAACGIGNTCNKDGEDLRQDVVDVFKWHGCIRTGSDGGLEVT